jgi:hypothetical protein
MAVYIYISRLCMPSTVTPAIYNHICTVINVKYFVIHIVKPWYRDLNRKESNRKKQPCIFVIKFEYCMKVIGVLVCVFDLCIDVCMNTINHGFLKSWL